MAFSLEQAIDEAAIRMKINPILLRKRWDPNPNRLCLSDWALGLDTWRDVTPPGARTGRYRRGVGVAAGFWLYIWQPGTKVDIAIVAGRVVVSAAVQDMGNGIRTVLADIVAREFGLEPQEIEVRIGDSRLPEGPTSGGSRTTASIAPTAMLAALRLKQTLQGRASAQPKAGSNAPWRDLIATAGDCAASAERPPDDRKTGPGITSPIADVGFIGVVFGWMMRQFSGLAIGAGVPSSVQVAEVEVDCLLGHVRVLKVHTGIAVGKVAAPALARSQAAGSIIQGVGYALYEGREIDLNSGAVLSAGLEDYRIPGIADTPLIDVHFDEGGFDHVAGGSVGIGEVATVPTSAAIANAIRNATGVRLTEIPIRPDRLLAALKSGSAA
jgi:xanthine dehydrogenase YagR molybdenum-binding subunit